MNKIGQLRLFEGTDSEKVFADANAYMREKRTPMAHITVSVIESQLFYTIVVFYDVLD
jgi:hypothetical protein